VLIHANDRLENPVTGEVMIFRRTARDTGGDAVLVETIVRPGGFVAAAHLHPRQTERFEVLEGQLGLQIGSARLQAGPGEVATVEPGTPHRFWNAGEGAVRFLCEVRPALEFESLIETMRGCSGARSRLEPGSAACWATRRQAWLRPTDPARLIVPPVRGRAGGRGRGRIGRAARLGGCRRAERRARACRGFHARARRLPRALQGLTR
jgi:quercetin dioxygenase-like cupin family protein